MIPNTPHIKEITNEPDFSSPVPVTGPRPNRPDSPHSDGKTMDRDKIHQDDQTDQSGN
jgi:hypothetical protein